MVWAVFWLTVVYCCLCYICIAILYFKIEVGLCNQTNVSNNKMHGALGASSNPSKLIKHVCKFVLSLLSFFFSFTKFKLFVVLWIIATENTNLNNIFYTLIRHKIAKIAPPTSGGMDSTLYPLKMCCDVWHQFVCSCQEKLTTCTIVMAKDVVVKTTRGWSSG